MEELGKPPECDAKGSPIPRVRSGLDLKTGCKAGGKEKTEGATKQIYRRVLKYETVLSESSGPFFLLLWANKINRERHHGHVMDTGLRSHYQ